jgi:hypothetical protein
MIQLRDLIGYEINKQFIISVEKSHKLIEAEHMGVPFSRTEEGKFYQSIWKSIYLLW